MAWGEHMRRSHQEPDHVGIARLSGRQVLLRAGLHASEDEVVSEAEHRAARARLLLRRRGGRVPGRRPNDGWPAVARNGGVTNLQRELAEADSAVGATEALWPLTQHVGFRASVDRPRVEYHGGGRRQPAGQLAGAARGDAAAELDMIGTDETHKGTAGVLGAPRSAGRGHGLRLGARGRTH